MNIKTIILVSILMAVHVKCDHMEVCRELNNVTLAEVDAISGNAKPEDISLKVKCYSKCLLQNILGPDGKVNVEHVSEYEFGQWIGYRAKLEECRVKFDHLDISNNTESCVYAANILFCLDLH